jgi:haloalkane dehalogenase
MVANGGLPIADRPMPAAFRLWRAFARYSPWFPVSRIVQTGTAHGLESAHAAAYDAPFPDSSYKAGARAFPKLVPISEDDPATPRNRRAWEGLAGFTRPFLCVFGKDDPILGRGDRLLISHVKGAEGQPHARIPGGHFIQEDQGEELARRLMDWANASDPAISR